VGFRRQSDSRNCDGSFFIVCFQLKTGVPGKLRKKIPASGRLGNGIPGREGQSKNAL
jgi:hypothetical protein